MDESACGVFATVIPVLLLAGVLDKRMLERAADYAATPIVAFLLGSFYMSGEIVALTGVLHKGLSDTPAQYVVATTIVLAIQLPLSIAMHLWEIGDEIRIAKRISDRQAKQASLQRLSRQHATRVGIPIPPDGVTEPAPAADDGDD